MKSTFGGVLFRFLRAIESFAQTFPTVCEMTKTSLSAADQECTSFISSYCKIEPGKDGKKILLVPVNRSYNFEKLNRKQHSSSMACVLLPRAFIVSLISEFDAFLGKLIRVMFLVQPGLLNTSDRNMKFSELVLFSSVDEAREYVIEKEVESILRDSHPDQFLNLEKKLGMPLTKGLSVWHGFIELTERRNLFVHNDGTVSRQYIQNCQNYGCKLSPEVKPGVILDVDQTYFQAGYQCLFEIAVKLTHVVWRKLMPDPESLSKADTNLTDICFDLIRNEEYQLAITLLEFATQTLKKHSTEQAKLIFKVNLAQSYKWNGDLKKCEELVNSIDWSALEDKFQLAADVLLDKYKNASNKMRGIGPKGKIRAIDYHEWPLFKEFRQQPEFLAAYKEVFGEEYGSLHIEDSTNILTKGPDGIKQKEALDPNRPDGISNDSGKKSKENKPSAAPSGLDNKTELGASQGYGNLSAPISPQGEGTRPVPKPQGSRQLPQQKAKRTEGKSITKKRPPKEMN